MSRVAAAAICGSLAACGGPLEARGTQPVALAPTGFWEGQGEVRLLAPAHGAHLSGIVVLRAAVAGRPHWVDFLVDGVVAGSAADADASYAIDVSRLPAGPHVLEAAAWDDQLRRVLSAKVEVITSAAPFRQRQVSTADELLAAVRELEATGGRISLAPGNYPLAEPLSLGPDLFISGAGPSTVLMAATPRPAASLVRLAGSRTTVRDLAIDYRGGTFDAVELASSKVEHVLLQRLQLRGLENARSGIELWGEGHRDISVQDCALDGSQGGSAGLRDSIYDDASSGDSAFRNTVRRFADFGIAFLAFSQGTPRVGARNLAVMNEVTDIANRVGQDGRSEAAIWLGGQDNLAYGNTCARAAWELIWTGSNCLRCRVEENILSDSKTGIYLEHSSDDALLRGNRIRGVNTGVNAEWAYGGVATRRVRLVRNDIEAARVGVSIDVGADDFALEGNRVRAGQVAVKLSGASRTSLRGNDLRPAAEQASCIREQAASRDDGSLSLADYTTAVDNDCRGSGGGAIVREDKSGAHDVVGGNRWP